jgi:peptidyl-tRNA hydrolase
MSIVIRRDLNMSPGLLSAQVLHTGMEFIRIGTINPQEFTAIEREWITSPYVSVLAVDTPEELQIIKEEAISAGLRVLEWEDTIPCSVLIGKFIKCVVGISIGPDDFDAIKRITGNLPLY